MKLPTLALLALALTACAGPMAPPGYPVQSQSTTPADTLWTRAVARYSDRQKDALDYAIRCDAALAAKVQPCDLVVDELAEYDDLAAAVQNDGDAALKRGDLPRLRQAAADLDAVGDEITFAIMKGS